MSNISSGSGSAEISALRQQVAELERRRTQDLMRALQARMESQTRRLDTRMRTQRQFDMLQTQRQLDMMQQRQEVKEAAMQREIDRMRSEQKERELLEVPHREVALLDGARRGVERVPCKAGDDLERLRTRTPPVAVGARARPCTRALHAADGLWARACLVAC